MSITQVPIAETTNGIADETTPAVTEHPTDLPADFWDHVRFEMVDVDRVASHPGNVRVDLKLTKEYVTTIKNRGIRVPLKMKEHPDGSLEVVMGHRRLAGSIEARRAKVPALIAPAGPLADDYLDMWTENVDREGFTELEKATALFEAHREGASKAAIARATGLSRTQVAARLTAGSLNDSARAVLRAVEQYDWTTDQLAALKPLDDDTEAMERIAKETRAGRFDYQLNIELETRRERTEHDRIRAELSQAGITVLDEIPDGAAYLAEIFDNGTPITDEAHSACPGHRAAYDPSNVTEFFLICVDPDGNGHSGPPVPEEPTMSTEELETRREHLRRQQEEAQQAKALETAKRRLVISGNRQWRAAEKARRKFLTELLARKTTPRGVARFVTEQMLRRSQPLDKWMSTPRLSLLAQLTGRPETPDLVARLMDSATDKRLSLLQFAVVAAAHENVMDTQTWRTDNLWGSGHRTEAARWLAFAAELGYSLSPIEKAVADGVPYTGESTDTPDTTLDADATPEPDASPTNRPETPFIEAETAEPDGYTDVEPGSEDDRDLTEALDHQGAEVLDIGQRPDVDSDVADQDVQLAA